jgi:hypothetical protein
MDERGPEKIAGIADIARNRRNRKSKPYRGSTRITADQNKDKTLKHGGREAPEEIRGGIEDHN